MRYGMKANPKHPTAEQVKAMPALERAKVRELDDLPMDVFLATFTDAERVTLAGSLW